MKEQGKRNHRTNNDDMTEMAKASNNFAGVFSWGDPNPKLESSLVFNQEFFGLDGCFLSLDCIIITWEAFCG